ncbi:MAG: tRNA lysidine(34) synthetase TilS [Maribacter sp.]|nr:tRNA lysidine(34) synthetase TilS [Maribacter sp.]
MVQEFKQHIENQFPRLLTHRFILACSGGLDSVVLAHLCQNCGLDFALAHCNFRLRGAESDGDEEFVKELANKFNCHFFVTHFDTIGYINKNKVSVQVAARELRYHWFAEIMQKNNIGILVTAHHADDNLETFLINFSRGTGIDGLTGIPSQTDAICRPLLNFSRSMLLDYATNEGIIWREESTNSETKYLRNKIRHDIVPLLKQLHPTFMDNFTATQHNLKETALLAEQHIELLKQTLFEEVEDSIRIKVASLEVLTPIRPYLYALFKSFGFTEWDNVEHLLSAMSGKEVLSGTHRLVKDREYLLLTRIHDVSNQTYLIEEKTTQINTPIKLSIEPVTALGNLDKNVLYVDKETLKYPLTLRKWKNGDYFYPLGMKGKKKLSKFLKDEKVAVIFKEKQWLLCSGNDIIWVIGRRGDERFKITKTTENIIKFNYVP